MHLDTVVAHHVKLPFSFDFSHSLRKRSDVNNIIVEIIAEQGRIIGYGEGAPRSYVTGESIDSMVESIRRFTQHDRFPRELVDSSQIWDLVDGITNGKKHNSAICALETALLDALGKHQNRYIRDYFSKDFITDRIHYGAAISLDSREKVMDMCRRV